MEYDSIIDDDFVPGSDQLGLRHRLGNVQTSRGSALEADDTQNSLTLGEREIEASNNNIIIIKKQCKDDLMVKSNQYRKEQRKQFTDILCLVCIAGVSLLILLQFIHVVFPIQKTGNELGGRSNTYWIYPKNYSKHANKSHGILKHVHLVLNRVGYEEGTNDTPWTLLWSHESPFHRINLRNLSAEQKVNHFPGHDHIVCKVLLATSDIKYVPKAFRLPQKKKEFIEYAKQNKHALFLEKKNTHRGVHLKNVSEIDLDSKTSFVQEYMQKPFLVDGHKFDIGMYVVVTSVDPLRVYWYKGDVLFRYCPAKYYPFDPLNLDKYVIREAYLPTWNVPALAHSHANLGFSMMESFNTYVRSKGKDPSDMWAELQKAITEVFITTERHIIASLKGYASTENFFEMMRFDFIVDEDLKVHLLEANMSPNLSSRVFLPNQLLYEQILYNLFSLTGITRQAQDIHPSDAQGASNMMSAQKNIAVFSDECNTICKNSCEADEVCKFCQPCLNHKLKKTLLNAHKEFLHRGDFRRIIPPPMIQHKSSKSLAETKIMIANLSPQNKLLHLWYQGKCNQDVTWCT